jgi:hypothetical protein
MEFTTIDPKTTSLKILSDFIKFIDNLEKSKFFATLSNFNDVASGFPSSLKSILQRIDALSDSSVTVKVFSKFLLVEEEVKVNTKPKANIPKKTKINAKEHDATFGGIYNDEYEY